MSRIHVAMRISLWALLVILLGSPAGAVAGPGEEEAAAREAIEQAHWTKGPATLPIEGVAELQLPEGYASVAGEDARRIFERALHNPVGQGSFTLVFGRDWYLRLAYDDIGYVKDDEKGSLDATAILNSIREGTEAANKERAKRGWPPITVIGWHEAPHYDEQTHNLTWAVRGESQGHPVINYDTRLLGRRGTMRVKLVTDPETLPRAVSELRGLLGGYSFTKGNRYSEWVQGDKVAAVGLTALITGGAAAVAVKSGLLKSLWKLLVVAGAASLAFLKKLFKRSQSA
jgi:uncharacterized membrane-anchored protein